MADRFDLSGKVALVTGASGGLGLHFARTLADGRRQGGAGRAPQGAARGQCGDDRRR